VFSQDSVPEKPPVPASKDIPAAPESSKPVVPNKIIQVEKSETASVSMSVYKAYFQSIGYGMTALITLLYCFVQGLRHIIIDSLQLEVFERVS